MDFSVGFAVWRLRYPRGSNALEAAAVCQRRLICARFSPWRPFLSPKSCHHHFVFSNLYGRGLFIQPDGGGKDVFVHISAVEKTGFTGLVEGAKVSYEIVSDRCKESAGNLRL